MTVAVLSGLREVAADYDGFILDLWGVVHDGVTAYPGAVETLARLRDLGKATVMLSNAPRRARVLVELMEEIGIPRHLYGAVMSSGESVHLEMLRRTDPWFARLGSRCLHIGSEADKSIFEGLAVELVTVDDAEFIMNTGPDGFVETIDAYRPILDAAVARRLPMVCANPDLVVMREGRRYVCAGSLARYYEERGGEVRYRGKPDPAIYDACFELLGRPDRGRVLAVGDALHTDIAGARAAGIDCLFCTGGIHAVELETAYGRRPEAKRVEAAIAAHDGLRPTAAIGGLLW